MSKGDSPYSTGIASKNISQTMSTTNQQVQYKAEERAQQDLVEAISCRVDKINELILDLPEYLAKIAI